MRLARESSKILPKGVSDEIFVRRSHGSHMWDVDGNEYIDFKLGYGPVLLGHGHLGVQRTVAKYMQNGVIYGSDHELEIEVARKVRALMPGAEMIRYFVTGTEATMNAIKIARAHTGKDKIIKFEGHYHGFHDYVSFSVEPGLRGSKNMPMPEMRGIPKALQRLVVVREWNDFDAIEKAVKTHAAKTAAIIAEPVMANASVIPPQEGYLKFLRELCDKNGIVLIFDEVKTGFRIGKGGAQELFKVRPDLTALAKSFANGYPISAVTGFTNFMKNDASRDILPQGTYARNPVSLAAANSTLDSIQRGTVHSYIKRFGQAMIRGIEEILRDRKVEAIVQGYPSLFQILFTDKDQIKTYREFVRCNQKLFEKLQKNLLSRGVMIDGSNAEPMYTSSAHTKEDLEQTLHIFDSCLQVQHAS